MEAHLSEQTHDLLDCVGGSCRTIPVKQVNRNRMPKAQNDRHQGHLVVDVTEMHHHEWQFYCFNCGEHLKGDLIV